MPDPIRVLVVDDEADVRLLLGMQLSRVPDIEVVGSAGDGGEAVELAQSLGADAVVMDLLMPGVNGFDAIATLQQSSPDIGIVAYSGVAGSFVREEMDRRGVEVVLKSGNVTALAEAIRRSVTSRANRLDL